MSKSVKSTTLEPKRPTSVTRNWVNGCALIVCIFCLYAINAMGKITTLDMAAVLLATAAIPLIWETWNANRGELIFRASIPRSLVKYWGLICIIMGVGFIYWLFPYYRNGAARTFIALFAELWIYFVPLAFLYIWITDGLMEDPEDNLYRIGRIALFKKTDRSGIGNYLLGWVIKAFFLPFMLEATWNNMRFFAGFTWPENIMEKMQWFHIPYRFFLTIDLLFASIGYLMTLRLANTHIRSSDPTVHGWTVCLMCYPPFWAPFNQHMFAYEDNINWMNFFAPYPTFQIVWGCLILILIGIYAWSTLQFGIRFSNLTYRGIITNGPYRWSKHPAYLTKNLSWWLVSIPFVANSFTDALRMCILLSGINLIYYLRAKAEERHLSQDSDYKLYAEWMAQHGLLAMLKRALLGLFGTRGATSA
jgi:protein-S-isoprenylcysteine O-methyltransferase Ste14